MNFDSAVQTEESCLELWESSMENMTLAKFHMYQPAQLYMLH